MRTIAVMMSVSVSVMMLGCPPSGEGETLVTDAVDATVEVDATPPPTAYYAVMISDVFEVDCGGNGGMPGADIDAVHLLATVSGDLVSFATAAGGSPGDGSGNSSCVNSPNPAYSHPESILGPQDGDFSSGFVALAGGWVTAEFGGIRIGPEHTIQIYEVGVDECASKGCKDDIVSVALATSLDCARGDNSCSVLLSTMATGDATIPVSGL